VTMATDQQTLAAGPVRTAGRPVAAGAVLGVATFLAYLPGRGRSLDFDSAQTVGQFIRPGPPWDAFRDQAVFNNHPMFSFLEQLVRVVTGRTDAATMRILPILCGALAVAVLTWFAARRHGLAAGLAAGALLACNPTFVSLSRAVRGYSLLTLCALVATIVVVEDRRTRSNRWGALYVVAAGAGLATHLYMVPVIGAHVGMVLARKEWGDRWIRRFGGALLVGAVAYAGMAGTMLEAAGAHARVFQADMPWLVARMATGGGRASLVVAPLVLIGALLALRSSRAARGAAVALAVVLVILWAGVRSSALEERFFVWLVPGAAYLAAVAVGRVRWAWVVVAGSVVLAVQAASASYTADPTAYRLAAGVLRQVAAAGERGCVVNIGVPPMRAYLDTPGDFAVLLDPDELDQCDVVVVTAWWHSTADWFERDRRIIDAAEQRFPVRSVLGVNDPALVLSNGPLPGVAP
jgi:hypothetical protein